MIYKILGVTILPAVGQGTMGISSYDTIKLGIKCGMRLIDTAETYGGGRSEELVGQAVKKCRKNIFISTKISPEHLSPKNVLRACEGSLLRLQTDYIDLYQVHWPNPTVPLEETLRTMEKLVTAGKVRYIGVSNFSLKRLKLAREICQTITSIQVEYNLFDRTIEEDILPYCEQENLAILAYSPLDYGRVSGDRVIQEIAKKYNKTDAQIALNWLVSKSPVIAIPRSNNSHHIKENASAADFDLDKGDIKLINQTSPQPCSIPTDMIKVDRSGLFVPSAEELAKDIQNGETIKPIRVVREGECFRLVEGNLRYWAWVIAHNGKVPIRVLIR